MRHLPLVRCHSWLRVLPLAAVLASVGCGASTGKVSGKVTYGDKVVKGGVVMFFVEGKGNAQGQISEDGTYSIAEVPAGSAKVCVDTKSMNPANAKPFMKYTAPKDAKAPEGFGGGPDRAELERRYVSIPERYADLTKTTLTQTITGGAQTYDIKLDP